MVDFDPGMFSDDDMEDMTEEAYEDAYEEYNNEHDEFIEESTQEEDDMVRDKELDNVDLAAAAGFGYHMASDELEERRIAKNILDRKDNTRKTLQKISLKGRKEIKFKGSPAQRWMFEVATGQKTTKDPIDYTEEEQKQILQYEGEHDFE